jgi:hypothetical protein
MLAQPIFVTHSFACATSNSVTGNETPKLRGFRSQPPNCGMAYGVTGRANDRMLAPDAIATNWRPLTM